MTEEMTKKEKENIQNKEQEHGQKDIGGCDLNHSHTNDDGCGHEHDHTNDDGCGCGHDHASSMISNRKVFIARLAIATVMTIVAHFVEMPPVFFYGIFIAAYFLAGFEVLSLAVRNIFKGKVFDENFLMAIASLAAFAIGDMSEAVAVMIFYGAGESLQDYAVSRSKGNIENLMDIRPDYANLKNKNTGELKTVSPEAVLVGDSIVIKPGEKVPLDGKVLEGETFLDTKALTGESVPRRVSIGDQALSGSINTSGLIEIEVKKTFRESTVSKIIDLVQNASSKKAESEKFITKFARYYTPMVVVAAVAVAVMPPLLGAGTFEEWIYKGLSFLIISCPCALIISVPISFFGGIGGAAKNGVLVKGGNYLETLNQVDTIVFDKTGTLTKGTFSVTEIAPTEGVTQEELLLLAATAEQYSNHPIAKSIIEAYNSQVKETKPEGGTGLKKAMVKEEAGFGIVASGDEGKIFAGNQRLMEQAGIVGVKTFPQTTVHIARGNKYMGHILIADEIKEGTKEALAQIKKMGIKETIMLTGDNEAIAKAVAEEIGIDSFRANLLPGDKVDEFEKILKGESKGKKVAFVGDGINDAPVLTRADVGIAMGGIGSDAAIEAADIVLMTDQISKIKEGLLVAKKTKGIVWQNIIFALSVKAIVMVLAVLGITSIWFAIFADVGVALLATANATRAMFLKKI